MFMNSWLVTNITWFVVNIYCGATLLFLTFFLYRIDKERQILKVEVEDLNTNIEMLQRSKVSCERFLKEKEIQIMWSILYI